MHFRRVAVRNHGPIERLDIEFGLRPNGTPKPSVIVGQNGSGKTLLLSALLDALVEVKRHAYQEIPETPRDRQLRLQKKDYIRSGHGYYLIRVALEENGVEAHYTDLVSAIPGQEIAGVANEFGIDLPANFDEQQGFHKHCNVPSAIRSSYRSHAFSYFPSSRYENPAWLIAPETPELTTHEKYLGVSRTSLVKTDVVRHIESWLLDVILDRELYEKHVLHSPLGPLPIEYEGRNTTLRNLLNQLLLVVYRARDSRIVSARIGISRKHNRQISIILRYADAPNEFRVSPTFSHLSSGEIALLTIFASVLKEYDDANPGNAFDLHDVRGIAIVDEADLHLHIGLQKDGLPGLVQMLPGVQFIITTHSPFLMLGMKERFAEDVDVFELPWGTPADVYNFEEFRYAYETFVEANARFKTRFEMVNAALQDIQRPLVITEGKTDWMHLKHALRALQERGEYIDLNVSFLEYEKDMGDQALLALVKSLALLPHPHKVIAIFDRDNPKILNDVLGAEADAKDWGNNVFSFGLPVPPGREIYNRISIEFYYDDADIRTVDARTGKRLHFSNEVKEVVTKYPTTQSHTRSVLSLDEPSAEGEQDKYIYDRDCDEIVNRQGVQCALSKTAFARKVLDREEQFANFRMDNFRLIFDEIVRVMERDVEARR